MSDYVGPIMELSGLGYAYHRGERVIDDVDGVVERGRIYALIGPNASGKTTLMKLMLGLLKPMNGMVKLCGCKVDRIGVGDRASWMSYVPQRSSASFAFSVGHVVAMGRYALSWDGGAYNDAIDACELGGIVDKPYFELSVGQQQRVLLARALAQNSGEGRLVLLDEPTSAMDLSHIHRTMEILKGLASRGVSVVAILHDLNMAARYADYVWLLDGGRLVASGSWSDVMRAEVLEPVYEVEMRDVLGGDTGDVDKRNRPIFDVSLPDVRQMD